MAAKYKTFVLNIFELFSKILNKHDTVTNDTRFLLASSSRVKYSNQYAREGCNFWTGKRKRQKPSVIRGLVGCGLIVGVQCVSIINHLKLLVEYRATYIYMVGVPINHLTQGSSWCWWQNYKYTPTQEQLHTQSRNSTHFRPEPRRFYTLTYIKICMVCVCVCVV